MRLGRVSRDANLLNALVATFGFFFDKTLQPPSVAKSAAKVKRQQECGHVR
jgi:hypothetical protein